MKCPQAYSKVQSHVTREMERKADELLDKWLPEYTLSLQKECDAVA